MGSYNLFSLAENSGLGQIGTAHSILELVSILRTWSSYTPISTDLDLSGKLGLEQVLKGSAILGEPSDTLVKLFGNVRSAFFTQITADRNGIMRNAHNGSSRKTPPVR